MSETRKRYIFRLVARCVILLLAFVLYFTGFEKHDILQGFAFFKKFSWLHVLWVIWMLDMLFQLLPIRHHIPLGSQKLFKFRFKPIREKINREALRNYIRSTTISAYKVMILWCLLISAIGVLYYSGILNAAGLFLISTLFYVCDLICVLFWCPFRLLLKNRCCTTCRIFNWDHLMMFTPMLFVCGFYAYSLIALSLVVWVAWELSVVLHPERFWFMSNETLRCENCTDKLCTQYCQKLRPGQNQEKKHP